MAKCSFHPVEFQLWAPPAPADQTYLPGLYSANISYVYKDHSKSHFEFSSVCNWEPVQGPENWSNIFSFLSFGDFVTLCVCLSFSLILHYNTKRGVT